MAVEPNVLGVGGKSGGGALMSYVGFMGKKWRWSQPTPDTREEWRWSQQPVISQPRLAQYSPEGVEEGANTPTSPTYSATHPEPAVASTGVGPNPQC